MARRGTIRKGNARSERRWYLSTLTFKIAEPGAQKGVLEIEPAHWIDVTARGVNGRFVRRQRAKQIVKTGRKIARGTLDESLICLARNSRAVAFSQRSFGASWKPFECAQRIVKCLRACGEIGNRLRTDQPGMPLSISALVGNFFTNINNR